MAINNNDFEIPLKFTVDEKSIKEVQSKTTGEFKSMQDRLNKMLSKSSTGTKSGLAFTKSVEKEFVKIEKLNNRMADMLKRPYREAEAKMNHYWEMYQRHSDLATGKNKKKETYLANQALEKFEYWKEINDQLKTVKLTKSGKPDRRYKSSRYLEEAQQTIVNSEQWHNAEVQLRALNTEVGHLEENWKQVAQEEQDAANYQNYINELTDNISISNREIANMASALKTLYEEKALLESNGIGLGTVEYDTTIAEIDRLKFKLREYEDALHKTSNAEAESAREKARLESEARKRAAEQENARKQLQNTAASASKLGSALMRLSDTLHLMAVAQGKVYNNTTQMPTMLEKTAIRMRDLAPIAGQAGKAFNTIAKVAKGAWSILKKFGSAIGKVSFNFKSARKTSSSFGSTLKKVTQFLTKYLLGFRSFFYLYRRLRGQIGEGFKELAKQIPSVNESLSAVQTSLYQLRAGFAAAFAPIISAVTPMLITLINKLNEATYSLANFFATLTGAKTVYRATAVQQDYAKSLDKTANSTKNLSAGIDELNVLDASSSSTSAEDLTATFEEVAVQQSELAKLVAGFAMMIVDAWKKSDFTSIGAIIGEKLEEGLNSINWTRIQEGARNVASSLATLINGFVGTEGLATSIGETLGNAINTAITTLQTFSDKIQWSNIATFITEGIDGFLDTTNFRAAGEAIFSLLGNALDMAIAVTGNQDTWTKACEKIGEFLQGLDWPTLLGKAVNLGKNLLIGLGQIVSTATKNSGTKDKWKEVGTKIGELIKELPWDTLLIDIADLGVTILGGLALGILSVSKQDAESKARWKNVGTKIGTLLRELPWVEILGGMKDLAINILEGIGAAFDSLTGAPEGTGKKIAEAIGIVLITTKIASLIAKITGSGGLLTAFKKKDDALDKQSGKLTTEANKVTSVDTALLNVVASAGLVTGVLGALDKETVPAVNNTEAAVQSFGDTTKEVTDDAQAGFTGVAAVAEAGLVEGVGTSLNTYQENLNSSVTGLQSWSNSTLQIYDTWGEGVHNVMKQASEDIQNATAGEEVGPRTKTASSAITNIGNALSKYAIASSGIQYKVKSAWENTGIYKYLASGKALDSSSSSEYLGLALTGALLTSAIAALFGIPLAEGAVLPPNQPFLAMVGDQKHGTNVEAPLDTIKQAVAEVSNNDSVVYAIQNLTSVVEALNLTVNLDSKRIENGTRSTTQRRGAVIATGGIINYA